MGAAVKRYAWFALAVLALCYLLALALTGERPGPGLAAFVPQGVLRSTPLEAITVVELVAGSRTWRFERRTAGAWDVARGEPVAGLERTLPTALTLLRNSAPERTLEAGAASADELLQFGLDNPRLAVVVHARGAEAFTLTFGSSNALGSVRYARIAGHSEVLLLPAFVAEAWERVAGMQQ